MPSAKQKETLLEEFQTSTGAILQFLMLTFVDPRGVELLSFLIRYWNPRLAKPFEFSIGAKGVRALRAAIDTFDSNLETRAKRGARRAAS